MKKNLIIVMSTVMLISSLSALGYHSAQVVKETEVNSGLKDQLVKVMTALKTSITGNGLSKAIRSLSGNFAQRSYPTADSESFDTLNPTQNIFCVQNGEVIGSGNPEHDGKQLDCLPGGAELQKAIISALKTNEKEEAIYINFDTGKEKRVGLVYGRRALLGADSPKDPKMFCFSSLPKE